MENSRARPSPKSGIPRHREPPRRASTRGPWKLSLHLDEIYPPAAGLEPALALLRRAGIGHADLRVVNGRDSFVRLNDAELRILSRTLKNHRVKVNALETPVFKCSLRPGRAVPWGHCPGFSSDLTFDDHLWFLGRSFEIADRLGASQVRCFAFWREHELDEVFPEVIARLGQAAALAQATGRTLLLQNEPTTLAGTGLELARIVRAVNSPHLRAAYDVANSARLGGVPYPDDYRALHGLLGSVQVRFQAIDVRSGWGGPSPDLGGPRIPSAPFYFWNQEHLPIDGWVEFGGQRFDVHGFRTFLPLDETVGVDHRALFRRLKADGYNGCISVDPAYFMAGTGAENNEEIEANFAKTIPRLQQLIARMWPASSRRRGPT